MFPLTPEIKHRFAKEIINSSDGLEHLVILYSDKKWKLLTSETIIYWLKKLNNCLAFGNKAELDVKKLLSHGDNYCEVVIKINNGVVK